MWRFHLTSWVFCIIRWLLRDAQPLPHNFMVQINFSFYPWFIIHLQLQTFQVEDIKQDYETGKDGIAMITFRVEFDRVEKLEEAIKDNCSRDLVFYKHWYWVSFSSDGLQSRLYFWICSEGNNFQLVKYTSFLVLRNHMLQLTPNVRIQSASGYCSLFKGNHYLVKLDRFCHTCLKGAVTPEMICIYNNIQ